MATNKFYLRASSAARLALCPGSGRACWGIDGESSEAAERGTRIHAWLAYSLNPRPNVDAMKLIDSMVPEEIEEARIIRQHTIDLVGAENYFTSELELTRNGWTGHIDLIAESEDFDNPVNWLIDYKTGRAYNVDPAEANAQMRVYAVLYGKPCRVAIITPRGVHSVCEYTAEDIAEAAAEMESIRVAALSPYAHRVPSPEACQYCPAFGGPTCPETAGAVEEGHDKIVATSTGLVALASEDLGRLGQLWKVVKKRGGQVEDEIRTRLESGLDVPGCKLRPGGELVNITDVYGALTALEVANVPTTGALSMSFAKAVDAVAFAKDLNKDAARAWLEKELDGMIERKLKASSLIIGGKE